MSFVIFNLRNTLLVIITLLSSFGVAVGQCPTGAVVSKSHTDISCFDADDGTITVELADGTGPLNFELWDNALGSFVTFAVTEDEDPDENGNFRKVTYTNVYPSSFQVVAFKGSCAPLSVSETIFGTVVLEPTQLSAASVVTQDCDATPGVGTGSIDLTPADGTAPYSFLWNDGSLSEDRAALDAGPYSVDVRDANNCLITLNFNVPAATPADAGPATALVCGINSVALTANAPGTAETGAWTGPPGVTFTPNASDPNASADNLLAGPNVLTWTITDSNGLCPITSDNITVTFSPTINVSASITDVLCKGLSTGAIDITVTGGTAPFTYLWSNASIAEDIVNIPVGTYSVTVTDAASCSVVLNNISVAEPADAVSGTTTAVDVVCFGGTTGSIAITGTGGVAPYDFSIDNGATFAAIDVADHTFTNLSSGNYDLVVRDANGCISPAITETISEPVAVSGTTTKIDVSCFGASTGSITITGAGGVGPYDFSIDGGATYPASNAPDQTFSLLAAGTYNLMVKDASECVSAIIPITIAQPAASVTGSTTTVDVACFGNSTGSITITGLGGAAPYDFSIDGGTSYAALNVLDHTFTLLAANTYNLMVRDANACTSAVIPVTITQPGAAVSGTTSQADVTCFGSSNGSITVTGAGGVAPYDFSIDGGSTFPVSNPASHTFINLSAANYNIVVRDANGCPSAVIPVNISQPPSAVAGSTTKVDVTCFGANTGSITVTGSGGIAPYDFSIDAGATYPVAAAAGHTFTNLIAGNYDLTVRDANGCETAIIPVEITGPVAAVDGTLIITNVDCFGASTGSISITGSGGAGPYDFSMDGGATYAATDVANHVFGNLAAASFNLMARDANGCTSPVIPAVITQPASGVTGTTTIVDVACFGAMTGSVMISGVGGIAPYDFSIDGGATYAASDVANHSFVSLAAGSYTLIVRDANGCTSLPIPVSIAQPSAAVSGNITGVDATCFNSTTGSISITGTGGTGPYDFSIDGGATYAAVDVASHNFPNLAAGNYNLMVRDGNGCESGLLPVVLDEPAEVTAVVSAVGAVTICDGSVLPDVVFTFTGVAPFNFTYTDGTTPVNIAGHGSTSFTIPTASAGNYSITSLADNGGCISSSLGGTIVVTVEVAATADAGSTHTVCAGGVENLTGASVGGSATTGVWTIVSQPTAGDGVLSNLTPTAIPSAVTFSATVAGSYILRLTTDNPSGICDADTDDVVINVAASATVDAGSPQAICDSGSATLSGSFTGSTGINWTSSGDGSFDDASLANAVYTPGPNDRLNNTVTLTITTAGPCASVVDNVVITINPDPTVDAGGPATICSNSSVVLSGTFGGSATGLVWSTSGDGAFDDATDPDTRYTPGSADSTNMTVTLTATATGSCSGTTDNVVITINRAAGVDAGIGQTVCFGSTATLNATLSGSAATITWTTSGDGSFDDINDPAAIYTPGTNDKASGTVTLTATTNNPAGPCPAANDNVIITLIPIPGDQLTAGNETWIGYVYDDVGAPGAPPANITFDNSRYRGFVDSNDIDNMSGASTYDVSTDAFDLNLGLALNMQGPNVCGDFLNFFSVRYKMDRSFAAGVYRFTVGSDDGARLLIDGVDVLPAGAFTLHGYTEYTSAPVCLSAGVHAFEIQYFDNTAQSRLNFSYEAVPALDITTPVVVCVNSPAPTLTVASSDTDVIDFNWYKNGTLVFTGTSYTPASAELDMAVANSTTFSVAASYACGETSPVDVVVDVFNTATLTMTPQTVCESGGSIDLRTLVDEVPPGGAFVFSGHPNISGNNFDPTGLAGSTVFILVDYSNGSCVAPQGTLEVMITSTATTSVPGLNPGTCVDAPDLDLTTLVTGLPAGGVFTFSGPQVSGNMFDPSGLSGSQTITVDYNAGGCVAQQMIFDIDVAASTSIVTSNSTICQNAPAMSLLTLVNPAPAGGSFTFSGAGVTANSFNPAGQSGTVSINVTYDFNGCTDSGTIQVTVLGATDPLCTGGNCASVVIVPKPEPATCTNSDGRLVMSLKPFTPAVNNTGVRITIDGISSTGLTISRTIYNDSTFTALPVGTYNYSIEYGDPGCIKTGQFSIDQSGTVGTPVVSNIVSPVCVGSATGSVTLDVPGETGNILEWSLDGGLTDPFKPFTAGAQITGIPAGPAPSFQQVISVRRNIADVCYSSVTFVMGETAQTISATFGITPATCSGNDGAITNILGSGGDGGPYTFSIDGGQNFQSGATFNGLAGGTYTLMVRDGSGCTDDFTTNVTFPGFINSGIFKNNADCSNGGDSGSISVTVNDPGVFQVALSTDQFNAPADSQYLPYSNPSVTFNSLPRGQYFVYVKSNSAACPTRSAPINIFGVYDINFVLQPDCNNNELSLAFLNVTGESSGAPLEIQVSKKLSADPPEIIYQQFPANGEFYLDHDQYTFLQTPGEYSIKIIQFQNEVVCNLSSESVDFTVPEQLFARLGGLSESYPDIPTGMLQVNGFSGGVYPYNVRIELDSASSFTLPSHITDFELAGLNGNQQIEMVYENIPAGRYQVEVLDSQGCLINLIARVPLDEDLFIPNVFTPNGDGSNDVFFIRNLPQEPAVNLLMITNRWGKTVFSSDNYQNNWDGEGVVDGIYFYRLQVSDNDALTGWIEIMRGQKP